MLTDIEIAKSVKLRPILSLPSAILSGIPCWRASAYR